MSFEYIKDKDGNLGVFIPIEIWEEMDIFTSKNGNVPQWHKDELDRREKNGDNLPENLIDIDDTLLRLDEI